MAANSTPPSPALQWIEEVTRNADVEQQNALAQILAQNADTEYLKGFNVDKETFKSKVPMVTHQDIQPLIRRIADGDSSPLLCAQPISEFYWSSGTSGEPKLIPSTKEVLHRNFLLFHLLDDVMEHVSEHVKGLDKGKRLCFVFTKSDKKTQGGITIRLSSTSLYKSDVYKNRPCNVHTSPNEAIYCDDTFQSMYTQLLCGLYEREQVNRIETLFAFSLVRVIKFLQLNWKQLTQDIRTGLLNPKVTDPSIRECMTRLMRPDSDLADHIGLECAKDNWEGIVTRIWPNTKYFSTIATGTMAQYIPTLDYYSGGLPIASTLYASSECFFGINLNPMCKPSQISYTFMPNEVYFEFLPNSSSEDLTHSQLVDLVDVEIGKEYEVVVTTTAGLYRYRVGDSVRATGFYNSSPQFQFVMRKNVVLNIDWEMTKETELQAAVENASQFLLRQFKTRVVDYTTFVDTTTNPDHYVIYCELQAKDSAISPSHDVLDQCCLVMEESLNWAYRRLRVSDNLIGPLEIRVVKNGTFEELMDSAISKGASMSQYKTPRCVGSKKPMLDLLESRVVSKHLSPSLPHLSLDDGSEKNLIPE
ncbi:probable indole-3-acetic acid-amido synthetase gh3.1 [Phtheirospermum japonicum]|uniref:Probable indole-3-acetic acid-amido synthetase gh3.1 n=1 Tax=Phtheirospermum japonicum TaxID=374723 RepID=A0A830DRZ2_9LAMI|nr:probable indole-3-acetic acid-amido synthetase gh3.1 [Phtheirospermum japonicum]